MTETLVLNFRRGGSKDIQLGDPIDDGLSQATLDRARALLISRGEASALTLLDDLDFMLHEGTNGFGDRFIAVHAFASPAKVIQFRTQLEGNERSFREAGNALRAAVSEAWGQEEEVRFVAVSVAENMVQGSRGQYSFAEAVRDSGGFATIHVAHDHSGDTFALKRLHTRDAEAVARLRREIQEQLRIRHPNVMNIVDYDDSFRWFIMPLAQENLAARAVEAPLGDALLCEVLRSVASGLQAEHALGLVHRDVTPRNILRLEDRWVVADWGFVRRPLGMTTMIRTQGDLGTNGFAAPELFRHAHEAGPAADVYSLGRVAAWAVARTWPEQNVPLVPAGRWRQFIRRTTEHDASRRPQSMQDVLELLAAIERELDGDPDVLLPPSDQAHALVERISNGELAALDALVTLALEHADNAEMYIDEIATMDAGGLLLLLKDRPDDAEQMVQAMRRACAEFQWNTRSFNHMNVPLHWFQNAASAAEQTENFGLLEDAASALFELEPSWDRYAQQDRTRRWLASLHDGEGAETVARALRSHPEAAALYLKNWSPRATPRAIRVALIEGDRAATAAFAKANGARSGDD